MRFQSIIVVTYGRTGSTLLLSILNSLPGILLRGENQNAVYGLFNAYLSLTNSKKNFFTKIDDSSSPFYGNTELDERQFLIDARQLMRNQLVGIKEVECWGFKEVRYTPSDLTIEGKYVISDYLDFLVKLFPNPAIIFLTRNIDDVLESGFWRERNDRAVSQAMLELCDTEFERWQRLNTDRCFDLDYTNIVANDDHFKNLFKFLECVPDFQKIEKLKTIEHSYGGKAERVVDLKRRRYQDIVVENTCDCDGVLLKDISIPTRVSSYFPFIVSGILEITEDVEISEIRVDGSAGDEKIFTEHFMDDLNLSLQGSTRERIKFTISSLEFLQKSIIKVSCILKNGLEVSLLKISL